ncbi:MAG: hypothetical protein AAFN94_00690 [Pseudomonadota bacterium]
MRHRLGIRRLELLRTLSSRLVLLIGDQRTARLAELGLVESAADGHFVRITAAGLRAVADAADAGRLPVFDESIDEMQARLGAET